MTASPIETSGGRFYNVFASRISPQFAVAGGGQFTGNSIPLSAIASPVDPSLGMTEELPPIMVRRAHDYEPVPGTMLATGNYRRDYQAYSDETKATFNRRYAEEWKDSGLTNAVMAEINALLHQDYAYADAVFSNEVKANWGSDTPPGIADYEYWEEIPWLKRQVTRVAATRGGALAFGFLGANTAEISALNPGYGDLGEYASYATAFSGIARAGVRRVAGEGVELAAGSNSARFVFDAPTARYRSVNSGQFVSARDLPWPGNGGFVSSTMETVPAGTVLDRFGSASGRFLGEPGASASARGMAAGSESMAYSQYRVVEPFSARVGPAAPVPDFGALGARDSV